MVTYYQSYKNFNNNSLVFVRINIYKDQLDTVNRNFASYWNLDKTNLKNNLIY